MSTKFNLPLTLSAKGVESWAGDCGVTKTASWDIAKTHRVHLDPDGTVRITACKNHGILLKDLEKTITKMSDDFRQICHIHKLLKLHLDGPHDEGVCVSPEGDGK